MPQQIAARLPSVDPNAQRVGGARTQRAPQDARPASRNRATGPGTRTGPDAAGGPDADYAATAIEARQQSASAAAHAGEGVVTGPAAQALLDHVRGDPTEALRAASAGLGPNSTRALGEDEYKPVRLAQVVVTSNTLAGVDTHRMSTAVSRLAGSATVALRSLLAAKAEENDQPVRTTVRPVEQEDQAT